MLIVISKTNFDNRFAAVSGVREIVVFQTSIREKKGPENTGFPRPKFRGIYRQSDSGSVKELSD
jgi:hypothetical protein